MHTAQSLTRLFLGVRVLIYVGTNDLACNFIGNYRTVQGFDWSGADAFTVTPLKDWTVNGHVAGETKTHGRLTFATVRGAGHMVSNVIVSCALYLM
jgi:carboxypeptidase C (cathepsin A)